MKRLVCIIEGKGEREAIPNLCSRILQDLSAYDWFVDQDPIRWPRGKLVDARHPVPGRPCRQDEVHKALEVAAARKPGAILVMCDADDDCPGPWASSVPVRTSSGAPVAAVMAVREFESWLLWGFTEEQRASAGAVDPERTRGAKERLAKLEPGYAPTTHQLKLTRRLDITSLRRNSRSFDKLVRVVGSLCGVDVPPRPGASPGPVITR